MTAGVSIYAWLLTALEQQAEGVAWVFELEQSYQKAEKDEGERDPEVDADSLLCPVVLGGDEDGQGDEAEAKSSVWY